MPAQDTTAADAAYGRRLSIIVPYRDRASQLQQFLPHIAAYFRRDKLDCRIDYRVHVVEQHGSGPFNRGRLKNAGYLLSRGDADYFCFHDVDYLPVWADYSCPRGPARLIWHGLTLREDHATFFGAVVMFPGPDFVRINGYSNEYWGWGYEDAELRDRVLLAGLAIEHRDGTYLALPHPHAGVRDGSLTAEARANQERYAQRAPRLAELMPADGFNSLAFTLRHSQPIAVPGEPAHRFTHHVVDV
jgi:hypothetical protein